MLKPLRFSAETSLCRADCMDPLEAARLIEQTGADALVLDMVSEASRPAPVEASAGNLARTIRDHVRLPIVLAGGLHAGTSPQPVPAVHPYGVDVISGVEDPVGRKEPSKLNAFVQAVMRAAA